MTEEEWRHRAKCLQAEVSARSAAAKHLKEQIDYLEEGLREAREQVAALTSELEFRRVAGNRSLTE